MGVSFVTGLVGIEHHDIGVLWQDLDATDHFVAVHAVGPVAVRHTSPSKTGITECRPVAAVQLVVWGVPVGGEV